MWPFSKKTTYTLTPTQELFLALLRAQLWLKPVDDIALPSTMQEFDDLMDLGYRQTVICFISAACLRHKDVDNIPTEIREEMEAVLEENKKIHEYHNAKVVEVFDLLEGEGLHPILLKGQGLAQIYPQPELRQCGDIDIYIGPKDYDKACAVMNKFCGPSEVAKAHELDIHYEISKDSIEYEIHRMAANASHPGKEKAFNKWAEEYLVSEKCDNVVINGKKIPVPPTQYNVIFVFDHLLKHFVCEGIKLRQMTDWLMLLSSKQSMLDNSLLLGELERYSQKRSWKILGGIMVSYLGLPESLFPLWTVHKAKVGSETIFPVLFNAESIVNRGDFYKNNKITIEYCQSLLMPGTMMNRKLINTISVFIDYIKSF